MGNFFTNAIRNAVQNFATNICGRVPTLIFGIFTKMMISITASAKRKAPISTMLKLSVVTKLMCSSMTPCGLRFTHFICFSIFNYHQDKCCIVFHFLFSFRTAQFFFTYPGLLHIFDHSYVWNCNCSYKTSFYFFFHWRMKYYVHTHNTKSYD